MEHKAHKQLTLTHLNDHHNGDSHFRGLCPFAHRHTRRQETIVLMNLRYTPLRTKPVLRLGVFSLHNSYRGQLIKSNFFFPFLRPYGLPSPPLSAPFLPTVANLGQPEVI